MPEYIVTQGRTYRVEADSAAEAVRAFCKDRRVEPAVGHVYLFFATPVTEEASRLQVYTETEFVVMDEGEA